MPRSGRKSTRRPFPALNERRLAEVMTRIQNDPEGSRHFLSTVYRAYLEGRRTGAQIIGVTGPPGAGKSTLLRSLLERAKRDVPAIQIAALLIDPSSPFSGGAFLGDRFRMDGTLCGDIFVRSLASRGEVGGLSQAARDLTRLLVASGRRILFVETVGVGQSEIDVMGLADLTLVILTPDSGDVIQTLKGGLMEIADLFVINKCDLPGCERMEADLLALGTTPVVRTEAIRQAGIEDLWQRVGEILQRKRHAGQGKGDEDRGLLAREVAQKIGRWAEASAWRSLKGRLPRAGDPYTWASKMRRKILK